MKILIFNWRDLKHSWAGGGEIYIFEQATRWVNKGHEVTVFCSEDYYNKLPKFELYKKIKIYRKGGRFSVYLWGVWYYFKYFRGKMDVVIDVVNGIPFFTPLFCRLPKICFVYHVHGNQFFYELPSLVSHVGFFIEKYIFPFLYNRLPIVAISKTTKKELIKIGFKRENISVIYCGINGADRIKKAIKKYSSPTILYLGRIKKYKRVDLLVKIFPAIIKKVPRAKLIIAGWGTEASYLSDLVMQSPLRRKISLLGPVSIQEKKTLLSKAWIFVNPSIGEGWSLAVIEANLYGMPSVAFNVSGLSESIKHKHTGLLARDQNSFIRSIHSLLTNKKLYDTYSMNTSKWARNFSWDKTAQKSLKVLQKIYEKK